MADESRQPPDGRRAPSAADVVAALYRSELAGNRHRAARAEQLRLEKGDLAALEQLAASDGLTPSELGQRLGLSSGGVTVLVDRLQRAGRVERHRHPDDRRKRILSVTPDARDWLREYLEPIVRPLERAAEWLSDGDREVLVRFLDHLAALREIEAHRTPRYSPPREHVPAPPVW